MIWSIYFSFSLNLNFYIINFIFNFYLFFFQIMYRAHPRIIEDEQNAYDDITDKQQKSCDYELSERVVINVSGLRFETQLKT